MNLYLRNSASARSHRRRHLSRLPPFPGMNLPADRQVHSQAADLQQSRRLLPRGAHKHLQPAVKHRPTGSRGIVFGAIGYLNRRRHASAGVQTCLPYPIACPTQWPAPVPTCRAVVGVIPREVNPLCRGASKHKKQNGAELRFWHAKAAGTDNVCWMTGAGLGTLQRQT